MATIDITMTLCRCQVVIYRVLQYELAISVTDLTSPPTDGRLYGTFKVFSSSWVQKSQQSEKLGFGERLFKRHSMNKLSG